MNAGETGDRGLPAAEEVVGQSIMDNLGIKQTLVTFRSSQQTELRADLLRLTRYLVVFELYSQSGSFLQSSEVLSDFKIICGGRLLYAGRAVVRAIIQTGALTVIEASLGDSWRDVDGSLESETLNALGPQFEAFVRDWQKLYLVRPEYKVAVADLHSFLSEARLWLEQVELNIRSSPSEDRLALEQKVLAHLEKSVVPSIQGLFERFEQVAQKIDEELQPVHRIFGQRQLHPLLLASPFVYRTFAKPLGYAGDYEMVNMMFRQPYEGSSVFGKVINSYALQLPPIVAHRNRIQVLTERLAQEALRAARKNRVGRVFSMGCGPAQEVQAFLKKDSLCERLAFTLVDFNQETLAHAQSVISQLKRQHGRNTTVQVIKQSVQQLLKQADRVTRGPEDHFDLIYCAGLFDYLSEKVCRRLMEVFYGMCAPGGLLLATNVDVHPSRGEMEHFLEWNLIHRNTSEMAQLVPPQAKSDEVSIEREPSGVNTFLCIRKGAS